MNASREYQFGAWPARAAPAAAPMPTSKERSLLAVVEQDANGVWRRSKKPLDAYSDISVEYDILIGFNCLVCALACVRIAMLACQTF